MEAAKLLYRARTAAADFLGGSPERVCFTCNTTYAVNLAMKSVLRPGDRILLSDIEHNAVYRPAAAMAARGCPLDFFSVSADPAQTLRCAEAKLTKEVRILCCLSCSNLCPLTLPVEELGRLCRERGVLFLVDAAQSAGHTDINAEKWGIDALCVPGHKGLYGPQGCGFLMLSERFAEESARGRTLIEGGSGILSEEKGMPARFPERFEAGTLPMPAIAGLLGGLRFLSEKGDAVRAREEEVYRIMRRLLLNTPGVKLYLPEAERGSCLLFNLEGMDSVTAGRRFAEYGICLRDGLHCAPLAHRKLGTGGGALRASFGGFNHPREAEYFAWVLGRILRER